MRTAVLSDLHLGSSGGIDLLRRPEHRQTLWEELEGADEVVLLGDALELRDRPLSEALDVARPFFAELGVRHRRRPGRGRARKPRPPPAGAVARAAPPRRRRAARASSSGSRSSPARWPSSSAGPGWSGSSSPTRACGCGKGVYATHGHFLDRHLTVPTFERLAVAAVERVLAGSKDAPSAERLAAFEAGAASPDDYERAQAPVYAFLFALAQAGTTERAARAGPIPPPGSGRRWGAGMGERLACGAGCWARSRYPGAVGVANRLGLGTGQVRPLTGRDDPRGARGDRRGRSQAGDRGGPPGLRPYPPSRPDARRAAGGASTAARASGTPAAGSTPRGCSGRTAAESPYWPGTVVVLEGERQPELRHLLDHLAKDELGD